MIKTIKGEHVKFFRIVIALMLMFGEEISLASETRERAADNVPSMAPLTKAHIDKGEFLRAVSLLGRSAEADTTLLSQIVGVNVRPVSRQNLPSKRFKNWNSSNVDALDETQIVKSIGFDYGITLDGIYVPSIRMFLRDGIGCIRFDDLIQVLGSPSNNPRAQPSPHMNRPGPSDIWSASYVLASGATFWIHFSTKECASTLSVSSMQVNPR